jgi:YHS domain-containing protein
MIFLLRLAALAAAFILLRWLVQWVWRTFFAPAGGPRVVHQGALRRDPVCGAFVDPVVSLRTERHGVVEYFCSERCRDAHNASQPVEIHHTG